MTIDLQQGVPGPPMVGRDGAPTGPWFAFFVNLWNRTGGAAGTVSLSLDTIASIPGDLLYRAASAWQGLGIGTAKKVLRSGIAFPEWAFLDATSFAPVPANEFMLGPQSGPSATPSFRPLIGSDLTNVVGEFPGVLSNDNASAGNVGEDISSEIAIGAAVVLSSGVTANITQITLSAGDWDVWASLSTAPAGTTTQSNIKGWVSTASASDPTPPNGGCYAQMQNAIAAGLSQTLPLGSRRVTVAASSTINVFLSANVTFAVSTLSAYGFLGARRRR